jgi:HSP90 family molecular chaperone
VSLPIVDAAQVSLELSPDIIVAVSDDWMDGALTWCVSALAPRLECAAIIDGEVRKVTTEADLVATRAVLVTAKRDLEQREERTLAKRHGRATNPPFAIAPVRALLQELAREGAVVLVEGRDQGLAALEAFAEAPAQLYEQMLESSAIDEVFIDEKEFIARWRAMLSQS